jgi:hypothetical protein
MSGFLFNFQKRFAPAVESGEKLQTIRANRKDNRRPKAGDTAHLWTGLRTNKARLLGRRRVIECLSIHIDFEEMGARLIVVDGHRLDFEEAQTFARADGFESALQMIKWFRDTYKADAFDGFVTKWSREDVVHA